MASRMGFEGIELHFGDVSEIDWDELDGLLVTHQLKLTSIGTGRIFTIGRRSLSDSDEDSRRTAITKLFGMIDKVSKYRAIIIIGTVKGKLGPRGSKERQEAYGRLVASLKEVSAYAQGKSCRVVVEGINRLESDNINSTLELLQLIDDVSSPNLCAHLDTYHMFMEGEDIEVSVKMAAERIGHIHFADTDRKAPGQGKIDFRAVFKALNDAGYRGVIAFEYIPIEAGTQNSVELPAYEQEKYSKLGLDHLRSCWKTIQD